MRHKAIFIRKNAWIAAKSTWIDLKNFQHVFIQLNALCIVHPPIPSAYFPLFSLFNNARCHIIYHFPRRVNALYTLYVVYCRDVRLRIISLQLHWSLCANNRRGKMEYKKTLHKKSVYAMILCFSEKHTQKKRGQRPKRLDEIKADLRSIYLLSNKLNKNKPTNGKKKYYGRFYRCILKKGSH